MHMKTLYVADLDGTLLDGRAEVSEYTAEALNRLIKSGVHFSVATARTSATAIHILKGIDLNIPLIFMNGVIIYDPPRKAIVKKEIIPREVAGGFIGAIHEAGQPGLMYALHGDEMRVYYESPVSGPLQKFMDERIVKYGKVFTRVDDFSAVTDDVIYFCFLDEHENIDKFYSLIGQVGGMRIAKSRNIYAEGQWFIEIFNDAASKRNATEFLRGYGNYEKVVGFGDDYPDISLFEACDECYAMENAIAELKDIATGVIGANTDDGLARWLEKNAR